jgi:hypothetical protein
MLAFGRIEVMNSGGLHILPRGGHLQSRPVIGKLVGATGGQNGVIRAAEAVLWVANGKSSFTDLLERLRTRYFVEQMQRYQELKLPRRGLANDVPIEHLLVERQSHGLA